MQTSLSALVTTGLDPVVHAEVRLRKLRLQEDHGNCDGAKEPRPFTRTAQATYRWDARRRAFVTTSRELDKLEELNMKLIMGSGIAPWDR
jgi:hypothetical protein